MESEDFSFADFLVAHTAIATGAELRFPLAIHAPDFVPSEPAVRGAVEVLGHADFGFVTAIAAMVDVVFTEIIAVRRTIPVARMETGCVFFFGFVVVFAVLSPTMAEITISAGQCFSNSS